MAERALPKPGTPMQRVSGTAIPMPVDDVDTDRIIPARFLKCVVFEGLGAYAFYDERFDDEGPRPDHPLNDPRFADATVLVAGRNFGCGSSREHAPQSLMRFGLRAFVAESYSDIFSGNCVALGLPAVVVPRADVIAITDRIAREPDVNVAVDLQSMTVTVGADAIPCSMPEAQRQSLMNGAWDSTAVLLEARDRAQALASQLPYLSDLK